MKTTHHIFTKGEWRRARFLDHPKVNIKISVKASDYKAFGHQCPQVNPSEIVAMTDSGAQSCLWSLDDYIAAGFSTNDLIPVNMDLVAANKSPITINEAVILRLQGQSPNGDQSTCATMV